MNLSIGIVGLPNVGKSTLFNALLKKQQAFAANFPFATIEPNVGVVPVPDARLLKLAELIKNSENLDSLPPQLPSTVEFVDIAGLIAGAHKGEGLGNKFLSHIREVDAICHVVRNFKDENIIREGSFDPKKDFEVIETELLLADLQTLEKQKSPGSTPDKEAKKKWELILKLKDKLEKGISARKIELSEGETELAKEFHLLTAKPILIALNSDEDDLKNSDEIEEKDAEELKVLKDQVVCICAKTESELAELSENEQKTYLESLGVSNSSLERLIKKAFSTLGLMSFLTAGEKEVRAWTIKKETRAPQAAAAIHTDFEKNFIRADVVNWKKLIEAGGWVNAKQKGLIRSEGKEYIVQDGDVLIIKHSA
ncbi:TPA: redox-regulated ATPase YchF [Patescibacteria group bacterium]|nr:redox-regulated ATPase YchF [Patescibacteria group bacterium]